MATPLCSGIFDLDYIFGQRRQESCVEYCAEKNMLGENKKRQWIVEVFTQS